MKSFAFLDVMIFRDKFFSRDSFDHMNENKRLIIHLDSLPDINSVRDLERYNYRDYGRFAVLRDGKFWVQTLHSSYPADTETGWFWAVDRSERLLVSARGRLWTVKACLLENTFCLSG